MNTPKWIGFLAAPARNLLESSVLYVPSAALDDAVKRALLFQGGADGFDDHVCVAALKFGADTAYIARARSSLDIVWQDFSPANDGGVRHNRVVVILRHVGGEPVTIKLRTVDLPRQEICTAACSYADYTRCMRGLPTKVETAAMLQEVRERLASAYPGMDDCVAERLRSAVAAAMENVNPGDGPTAPPVPLPAALSESIEKSLLDGRAPTRRKSDHDHRGWQPD